MVRYLKANIPPKGKRARNGGSERVMISEAKELICPYSREKCLTDKCMLWERTMPEIIEHTRVISWWRSISESFTIKDEDGNIVPAREAEGYCRVNV